MAGRANLCRAAAVQRQAGFCLFHWLLLVVLLWLQCTQQTSAFATPERGDICADVGQAVSGTCHYGGFIVNPNPENCKDRYVCYAGPGEYCDDADDSLKCAHGLDCHCHACINCVGKNCFNRLCPESDKYKRWMKLDAGNLLAWGK